MFRDGSVRGEMEGELASVSAMKTWLQKTGSPSSRIERTVFSNERKISQYSFDTFKIIR